MGGAYDQIIVGGGVIGGSIAYQLSKRGYRVLVLESSKVVSEASSAAAGMLGVQNEFLQDDALFQFALKSRRLFKELADELFSESNIDIQYIHKGTLKLAFDQQQVRQLEKMAAFQNEVGNSAYNLSFEETLQWEKGVSKEMEGALFLPEDGQVSAPDLGKAFFKAAQNRGTVIHEHESVTGLIVKNGEINGVETIHGTYQSGQVVIATGALGSRMLTVPATSFPVKGECLELELDHPVIQSTISAGDCYIVPKRGGKMVVGASSKPGIMDKNVSGDTVLRLLDKSRQMLPQLSEGRLNNFWSGIRPGTFDGRPFLGGVPEVSGLYVSFGHYRNGILLSPVTGTHMADLLEGKQVDPLFDRSFNVVRAKHEVREGGG